MENIIFFKFCNIQNRKKPVIWGFPWEVLLMIYMEIQVKKKICNKLKKHISPKKYI